VAQATAQARTEGRAGGLGPAALTRAERRAGAGAGRAYDAQRRLRLLEVAREPGLPCAAPRGEDLARGAYPLASTAALVAARDARAQPQVERAALALREALGGPAPVAATVLRAR
jgi:hypothetical protein